MAFNLWNITSLIINGILLGLSSGVFCLSWCLPVIGPLILLQKRSFLKNFLWIGKFFIGRFIAYLCFGAIIGWLGVKIESSFVHFLVWIALIIMGFILILYALGFIKYQYKLCIFKKIKMPYLIGFLLGINICPPFLIALTYVFNLRHILQGVLFFCMFFIGTSVYFIPVVFLGELSKFKFFRQIAVISSIIVGFILILKGIINICQ